MRQQLGLDQGEPAFQDAINDGHRMSAAPIYDGTNNSQNADKTLT
jgi:hypothetical protein